MWFSILYSEGFESLSVTSLNLLNHGVMHLASINLSNVFSQAYVFMEVKLLTLRSDSILNIVTISRLTEFRFLTAVKHNCKLSSPIYELYQTAIKYNLAATVHSMLDTGVYVPRNRWANEAKNAIEESFKSQWTMSVMMYSRLNGFLKHPGTSCTKVSCWWLACRSLPQLAKKCRTLIAILIGEHNLGSSKGRFVRNSSVCQLCCMYVQETIHHFLLECDSMTTLRRPLLNNVLSTMPPAMVECFELLSYESQARFLLEEMGRAMVPEWFPIHRPIIDMVYELYNARSRLLQDIGL